MSASSKLKSAIIPASSGVASGISRRLPAIFAALLAALPIIPQRAVQASSPALTILHSFEGGTDIVQGPITRLTLGTDGNFYGTTQYGGATNNGTVFKMTPSGTTTILHFFGDGSVADDGIYPTADLIQTSDGNFYGTTSGGGTNRGGTVFKMTPSGAVTIMHAFSFTGTDGNVPDAGLIKATDGNFYGTTFDGGVNGLKSVGTVFRMTPSGTLTTMYSFGKTATDGVISEADLIQASDGDFYGTTTYGGTYNNLPAFGNGTIFKMDRFGAVTFLHRFLDGSTANDGITPTCALLQASDGNFYGTTQNGGAANDGTVFKMTPAGVVTILHSFADGSVADDGEFPYAGLIEGPDGNLYGTTEGGGVPSLGLGTIFKITKSGSETILHRFRDGSVVADGEHPHAALTLGLDGNLYGTTWQGGASDNGTIFRLAVGLFPPAPATVTATPGDARITLKWSASSGATKYNVYRGRTAGGESTTPLTTGVTTTIFVDTTVANNVTYYYKLKALNATGIGPYSPEASAKPEPAVPTAPKALTTVAGNAKVSLSWTATPGALSYKVYRGTTPGGEDATAIAGPTPNTSYVNTGLTNDKTYYYTVVAVNAGGVSPASPEASAKPEPAVPAAPKTLTAVAGDAKVSLSWTASIGATSYNVYRGTTAGGESTTPIASGLKATTYIDNGVKNGSTYYYVVAGVNTGGVSPKSNEAPAKPQAVAPAAPAHLTAVAGNAKVSLSWTASPGALSYKVYRGTTPGGENATAIAGPTPNMSYVNTGLTNGKTYYYTVVAINAGGVSPASPEASAKPAP